MHKILASLQIRAKEKYVAGADEHDEDMASKSVIDLLFEIRDEAIDTFIYAQTAIQNYTKDHPHGRR